MKKHAVIGLFAALALVCAARWTERAAALPNLVGWIRGDEFAPARKQSQASAP
jgi:hypothetical protein